MKTETKSLLVSVCGVAGWDERREINMCAASISHLSVQKKPEADYIVASGFFALLGL